MPAFDSAAFTQPAVQRSVERLLIATIHVMPYHNVEDPAKLLRLIDAVLMIEAAVELPVLLRHLIEEACSLVDARYGALGVLNEARTGLDPFITVGLGEAEEEAIGARPTGRGVLGVLITEPAPLRLKDLGTHPDSYGFPAHHPPMKSFIGVPVRARSVVYGNLYLTDKMGADEFSEQDQALAEALAVAAGIAIENTRLHERVRVLSVLDDRDRIARDLHDRVIQRVFAVGMALQGAARLPERDQIVERVNKAVDDLDTTVTEIRTAIFELGTTALPGGLRHSVLELTAELASHARNSARGHFRRRHRQRGPPAHGRQSPGRAPRSADQCRQSTHGRPAMSSRSRWPTT